MSKIIRNGVKRLNMNIPVEIYDSIEWLSKYNNMSKSLYVAHILLDHVKKQLELLKEKE